MKKAAPEDKDAVFRIRENPKVVRTEVLRRKEIVIHYEIEIPGLDRWNLQEVIASAQKTYLQHKIDEKDLDFF